MSSSYRYRFNTSQLDESSSELIVNGLVVDIQPQSLRLLALLLRYGGEVVSRQELEEEIWHGRLVGENVLASAITRLRSVLGESNTGLIEAIPRIGYRITVAIERTAVGKAYTSRLELIAGQEAPLRADYVLERLLAHSAAGEVWLARHRRDQTLRVYKYAADGRALNSLKREATLARVLHQQLGERKDLLRIINWNFEQAPFFLESEYGGENLLKWSLSEGRLQALSRPARLALFKQIARVVAAAHGVAVIHKDLKPSNVLISLQDNGWQLRLADFGSGRLSDQDRLEQLGITDLGLAGPQTICSDSASGTAMYLAPEILREFPATERSDIYALGVMLYQLLVGDLRRPMVCGWERDIDDPILVEDIAQATDGDPRRRTVSVSAMLTGLNNLSTRRNEREQQAAEHAQIVCDREIIRRNRAQRPWLIAASAGLALGLSSLVYAYTQHCVNDVTLTRRDRYIEALNQFLTTDLIGQANPAQTGRTDLTVQQAAVLAAQKIDAADRHYSPEIRAALHAAMQTNFDHLKNYKEAIAEGEKALAAMAQLPKTDPEQLDQVRVVYANSLRNLSRLAEASAQLDKVEAAMRQRDSAPSELLARYWFVRGQVAQKDYQWDLARHANNKAAAVLRSLAAPPAQLVDAVEFSTAQAARVQKDFVLAERLSRTLLEKAVARYGQGHYMSCVATQGLAEVFTAEYRAAESIPMMESAVDCLRKATGPASVATALGVSRLAAAYFAANQWDKSAQTHLQAAQMFEQLNGPVTSEVIVHRNNAARAMKAAGSPEKAKPLLVDALAKARTLFAENHPVVLSIRFHLADCLLDMADSHGVAALLAGLDAHALYRINPDPTWEARLNYQRGRLALYQGDKQTAASLLQTAAETMQALNPRETTLSVARIRQYLERARS